MWSEMETAVLVLTGPIGPADIPGLCERMAALLDGDTPELVVCDVGGLGEPDACAVDALARMQLTAHRLGHRVWLRDACGELRALVTLMGLNDVLPALRSSGLEPGRQAEQREQVRRVEEEADPGDPVV